MLSGTPEIVENHEAFERTFISIKILSGGKECKFSHGTEHTQSVQLKGVPQSDFKAYTYILKISESKLNKKTLTHTHTHADIHTQSVDILCVT
jgi:hypothetical protein